MCRLFGLSGGSEPVTATFWLLEAPDSLAAQSRREPDGTGLGSFAPDGTPRVSKQPLAAYEDRDFARQAREVSSPTFVAHVRYASTGDLTPQNTHPFEQAGRLFAHNGVIGDLPALERRLGDGMRLVGGETDSERFFALITLEIERHGGDVAAGIEAAARWVAGNLPVLSLNFVLIVPRELWALRYPDTHELYVLERSAQSRRLEHSSDARRIRVHSADLADRPAVVVATERMDEDPAWRLLDPGELLHVDERLGCHRTRAVDFEPAHRLTLADLDPRARASQSPGSGVQHPPR